MATRDWKSLRETAEVPNNDPLPPGNYNVAIENVEVKSTQTQKTMFVITMKVIDGPHAGRRIWNNMVVSPESPKAMGFFFKDMAVLGADDAFFDANPDEGTITAKVMACPGVAITVRMQRNDPTRNEVARMQPLGTASASGGAVPPAPAQASAPPAPGAPPARPF